MSDDRVAEPSECMRERVQAARQTNETFLQQWIIRYRL